MSYITLTPEVFFDEDGRFSIEYLSQHCQSHIATKINYTGSIFANWNPKLKFNNIVKAENISTYNIVDQFPDLEETYDISYYCYNSPEISDYNYNTPDIGNLKSTCHFYMPLNLPDIEKTYKFIKKYIKFIDKNTLIINDKILNVSREWHIGPISQLIND